MNHHDTHAKRKLTPSPKFPLPVRVLNAVGKATHAKSLKRFKLEETALKEAAVRATGLSDFGSAHFEGGLRVLLASLKLDTSLHFFGQLLLRQTIVRSLSNRLLLVEAQKRRPEVFSAPLTPPLIVLGLPRSGTTHLHRLLAQDPEHHAPPYWELLHPLVQPGEPDHRRKTIAKGFAISKQVIPTLDNMHFITADTPEEDYHLVTSAFESFYFCAVTPLHSYTAWYLAQDHTQQYREYRAWLQVLQASTPGKRLVLKSPAHTGGLAALLRAVPEAQPVQIYRDPATCYASFNSLTAASQVITSERRDLSRMAETNLQFFAGEMVRNIVARSANPRRVYDVHYDDLITDPKGTLEGIYKHFGLGVSDACRINLSAYINNNPRAKHGAHHYTPGEFGVSAEQAHERLAPYRQHFQSLSRLPPKHK